MNRLLKFAGAALFALALVLPLAHATSHAADPKAAHWVCPACASPCDTIVFDAPGTCPACGMALITQEAAAEAAAARAQQPAAKKVAILVFNGVEIIDFSGPYEMFGTAGYDVYTVGMTKDPVTTAFGMKVVPQHSFADAPAPDVLLVPGGGVKGACDSQPTLDWVRTACAHSEHTLSVCNGAFILASAGLLDGLTATTTARLIDQLHTRFPKVNVVHDRRFVDNGKIVTAAGLSSGIDGALHVLSVMEGHGAAQQVALQQEYDWKPKSGFARAALADMAIPNVNLDSLGTWNVVRTEGDRDQWDLEIAGASKVSPDVLLAKLDAALVASGTWSRVGGTATDATSRWNVAAPDGRKFTATLKLEPERVPANGRYIVRLALAKAS